MDIYARAVANVIVIGSLTRHGRAAAGQRGAYE